MGFGSIALSFCTGFYFRNTLYGSQIGDKIFAAFKRLKKENFYQHKLVLIVREDLNMSSGKIASQCSHASVLAYKNSLLRNPDAARIWEALGQPKVVLKTKSEKNILKLWEEATKLGLTSNIVADAGKTQVLPGTKTVLAIGPGPNETVDMVTRHLRLL